MGKKQTRIKVQGTEIGIYSIEQKDYISLTDIAKSKDGDAEAADIIKNWIHNRGLLNLLVLGTIT